MAWSPDPNLHGFFRGTSNCLSPLLAAELYRETLTRAARDFPEKNPSFAIEAGLAALRWLAAGHGYEVTSLDVLNAYSHTMEAASNEGSLDETRQRVRDLIAHETGDQFVNRSLRRELDVP